jgi:hypothetical protein
MRVPIAAASTSVDAIEPVPLPKRKTPTEAICFTEARPPIGAEQVGWRCFEAISVDSPYSCLAGFCPGFLDMYRTLCFAAKPEIRPIFEELNRWLA